MPKITEIIKNRISCRTYSEKPIEDNVLQEFSASINAVHTGPFGNQPKFQLIKLTSLTPQEWKQLGTYGVIKNAQIFLWAVFRTVIWRWKTTAIVRRN